MAAQIYIAHNHYNSPDTPLILLPFRSNHSKRVHNALHNKLSVSFFCTKQLVVSSLFVRNGWVVSVTNVNLIKLLQV